MPHYPDEIEYSDKYCDDYYEYRHVILPKDVYKRLPRGRLLTENVRIIRIRNGDQPVSNNPEDGLITKCTSQNPTSFSSEGPRELTLKPDSLLRVSLLPLTPMSTEKVILLNHLLANSILGVVKLLFMLKCID